MQNYLPLSILKNLMELKGLAEHIVEDLEKKIINDTLKPGEPIIEKDLYKAYDFN